MPVSKVSEFSPIASGVSLPAAARPRLEFTTSTASMDMATVENSFTLELQLEAVDEAWTTLRTVVREELEDAEAALVAAA